MRFPQCLLVLLSFQACASSTPELKPSITPTVTEPAELSEEAPSDRIKASGFSFALPEGFMEKGKMHFVSTSSTSFQNIRVLQAPAPFRKITEKMCQQMTQGFVKQSQGKLLSQSLERRNERTYCFYLIQTEKFQFANAVTLNNPFALAVNVITESESAAILEEIVATFKFEAVKHIKGSHFEFPIPEGYVPFPQVVKPPAQALIRKERIVHKSFLGSLVIIPTKETSFQSGYSNAKCQDLASQMSRKQETVLKSAELSSVNNRNICIINSESPKKKNHHLKQFVIPAASHGALVITCNHDPKDKVGLQGCEELIRTIKITQ